ncbi:hypothetical protein RJ639_004977, partial [Escallonia herrerae]
MVKTKHQKSKPKKQPQKKSEKQGDISGLRAQLNALGLKIVEVHADGNCFFRSLADQLEGNEHEHMKYRTMVVQHILKNREMFEPFIEDDIPFDEYCQSMEKDGTWAGNMEVQAVSLVTRCNICIHRNMSPRWYIQNFHSKEARMIHLSYHDWEHYNSVRLNEDTCTGPARPVIIKADADLSANSNQGKVAVTKSKGGVGHNIVKAESIRMVIVGSGCENVEKVEKVLLELGGDVGTTIEYLIADQGTEEYLVESEEVTCSAESSHVAIQKESIEQREEECEEIHANSNLQNDEKKISRNKACPCGSKKKYKSCCGTVAGRLSARVA